MGFVRFNGLCVIERMDIAWFEDHGRPVRNYRLQLAILSEEFIDVDWLHHRALAESIDHLTKGEPGTWRRYRAGVLDRLKVWAPRIRSQADQLPASNSPDGAILEQLIALHPSAFEGAVVTLFEEMDVVHDVQQTRLSRDGGFDFSGTFTLPPPLDYEIGFGGEVKRYTANYVGPKDVSRLVARLGRGEYGLFVTTSYFSRQAQEEVLADAYPTRLFSAQDVVRMMRQVGAATGSKISDAWVETVQTRAAP